MNKWFSIARFCVSLTLLTGAYIHLTRLIFGIDLVLTHVVTPTFDSLFAIPMAFAAYAVIAARREYAFRNGFEKGVVIFTGCYFIASLPIHISTWFTHSTELLRMFPAWYSVFFLAFTTFLQLVWLNLKSKATVNTSSRIAA